MRLLQRNRKAAQKAYSFFMPLLIFALTFSIFSLSSIPVFAVTGNETIVSDQPEYMQGDTVFILGSGFQPNHEIVVQVIRVDNSIVTGNGTETPGSDIITSDPYGSFIYPYLLDGGDTSVYYGTLTVNAIDTSDMVTVLATTTFLDNPQVGLQGCSRERGDCTDSVTPSTGWADGINHMNGWTSGNVKGWYELEYVPYRLRINPREPSDAKTYYFTVEHDNLRSGVTGVDVLSDFYVGAGPDMYGYTEGTLTKNCVLQVNRLVGDNPTTSNPCIVTGPTYSGVDDDGNNGIDEDSANGIDSDGDGKVDEDPPPTSSTSGERRILYTVAVLFTSADVGHYKKWAIYWKAHLAAGSSGWPGASLHAHTSIGGSQDVPIKNVLSPTGADLSIIKSDSPDPVTAGGALTYTITVTNNGPASASNVSVTDTLPGSTTYVSANSSQGSCSGTTTVTCSLGSLANGASATVTIVVTANTAGTIQNKASVSSGTSDPSSSNNTTPWVYTTVNSPPSNTSNLSITKADSPDPVTAGGLLTYTITVANAGPDTATNVTVTDNLPGGVTNINASGSGWNCIMSGYVVTCSRPSLPVGTAPVITITVNAPSSGGVIANSASVTATQNDPGCNDNTTTIYTTVTASANLSITKTAFPDPVTAGGILTYTVTVANAGPSTATSVVVTDTLPTGTAFLSASGTGWSCGHAAGVVTCSRGTLAVGTAPVITISVTAPAEGGTINNTASVTSAVADPNTGNNNTGAVATVVTASADVTITKTDTPDPVLLGGSLTYTITATNDGPSTAANVTVTDTLPGGVSYVSATPSQGAPCTVTTTITCNLGAINNGASATVTIIVTPNTTGTINNSATVSTTTNDPTPGNNTASASTTVSASADLSITKTDTPDPVTVGGTLTYTITVFNNGPDAAANVTVTDTPTPTSNFTLVSATPSQGGPCTGTTTISCNLGAVNNGASATVTIIVTPNTTGTLNNSATVTTTTNDPTPGNNTASASTTVNATPSADLSITNVDSPDPVYSGASLTYTITVSNAGPSTATSLIVTDTLPPGAGYVSASGIGWTCSQSGGVVTCTNPSLASGSSAPAITVTITAPFSVTSMSSTAHVVSSVTDPTPTNNATASTTVYPPVASADLGISKTDSADPVNTGAALTYTITVINNGPDTATGVTVTDTLPGGVTYGSATPSQGSCTEASGTVNCPLGSLSNGASATIAIIVTPTVTGTITNTASVSSGVSDSNMANNNASQGTTVNSAVPNTADLSITKIASPDPAISGGLLTYTLTVTNNGPNDTTGVTVTDTLPAGVTLDSVTPSQGAMCTGTTTISCGLGSILNGGTATVIIVVTPTSSGTITNNANVTGALTDPNLVNNSVSLDTTVNLPLPATADLSITKTDSPDPVPAVGDPLSYTINVTNNGPNTATNVMVTDTLSVYVTYVSKSASQGTCSGTATITCSLGTLANGASATITINVTTKPPAGDVGNTASVTADQTDPNMVNNIAIQNTNVGDLSRLLAISTRAYVSTGNNREIAGFVIGGSFAKTLIIRGRGPSMGGAPYNISGTLANPYLRLYSSTAGAYIAQNDNWGNQSDPLCASSGYVCGTPAQITATGMDPCMPNPGQTTAPPGCANESVILITIPPGAYTAILSGVNNGTGVGLIEVYDTDGATLPKVNAISTRALVLTGTNRMIGGFTVGAGNGSKKILIKARGPSMAGAPYNISGTLSNPYVRLFSSVAGAYIAQNDNWGDQSDPLCSTSGYVCGTPAEITATNMDPCVPNPGQTSAPPGCSNESALLITVPPGSYTAVVSGVNGGTGVGLVEIYELP